MASPNWQVTHGEVRRWFEQGQSSEDFDAVCAALAVIVADPYGAGTRIDDRRAPVFSYDVPAADLRLVYLVAEQFHTVKIVSIIRTD